MGDSDLEIDSNHSETEIMEDVSDGVPPKKIRRTHAGSVGSVQSAAKPASLFKFEKLEKKQFFKQEDGKMTCLTCDWTAVANSTRAHDHLFGTNPLVAKCNQKFVSSQPRIDSLASQMEVRDRLIDYVVSCNLPFSTLESKEFKDFLHAVESNAKYGGCFNPPCRETFQKMLWKKNSVEADAQKVLIRSGSIWGLSLISDGRDFFNKYSVLNFYVNSPAGLARIGMNVKAGEVASSEYLCTELIAVVNAIRDKLSASNEVECEPSSSIGSVDPTNLNEKYPVAHVILDGTHTNVKALSLVESRLEASKGFVFTQICSAHGFSKLAEKLASLIPEFSSITSQAHEVIKLIKNRDVLRSALAQRDPRCLLGFCATRFAYTVVALERLWRLQQSIEGMMDVLKTEKARCKDSDTKCKFEHLIASVSDLGFWDKVFSFVVVFEPILVRVKFFDGALPGSVCWVLEAWETLEAEMKVRVGERFPQVQWQDIEKIIRKYRGKYTSVIHSFAHILEPSRWPLSNEMLPYYRKLSAVLNDCNQNQAFIELDQLVFEKRPSTFIDDLPAYLFWARHQDLYPSIAPIAMRICSGVASSSDCERDFSTMRYIWSCLRSRLKPETVNMLTNMYVRRRKPILASKKQPLTSRLARQLLGASRFPIRVRSRLETASRDSELEAAAQKEIDDFDDFRNNKEVDVSSSNSLETVEDDAS